MAAGSQSVESGRKSWTQSSWEKNPFFLGNRTLFNSRASPRCWRRYRLRPHTLHQGDDSKNLIGSNYESTGGLGGRRQSQRPFEPSGSFILWNIPFYLPLPGQPPPSAPKMAGIIPLVYLTNINVRSSGQISLFPTLSSPLSLLYTLQFDIGKRLFCPSEPYSANTSICLFCEKKSVAKAKVFFLLIQSAFFSRPRHPPLSLD